MNDVRLTNTVKVASETTEIVRGQEEVFLKQLEPIVRNSSIELDLAPVERIDAAGIAALIRLYCDAVQAGRRFTVTNPRRHVYELLAIVGIDRVLMSDKDATAHATGIGLELTAA
jgi:ABC-type transporter Mla MlaB component